MNWEMIGSIGEIIAGMGVILSLLYVGRQLKQSNAENDCVQVESALGPVMKRAY